MSSLRSRLNLSPETVFLVDGSAFVFRAFYAMQNMSRSDGFPTNILFIVTRMLLKIIREEQPAYFSFILDGKGPSHRHDIYSDYKANRSETPEALIEQLAPLLQIVEKLGLATLTSEGCEADDCIASLAKKFSKESQVVILGADKDLLQCLNENVIIWDPASRNEKITTLEDFRAENEMEPSSWPDYQALIGDSSDNIPGIKQVGPKTAQPLIKEFKTLEELFARLEAVPPRTRPRLEGKKDEAILYRSLTTLLKDACPHTSLEDLKVKKVALHPVLDLFEKYELRSLIREVQSMDRVGIWEREAPAYTPPPSSPSLDADLPLPEEKPKKAPTTPKNAQSVETSLFSLSPEDLKADPESFDEHDDLDLFKALDQASPLFILMLKNKLLIASKAQQIIFTGDIKNLADLAKEKELNIVTPDLKALLKKHKALRDININKFFDLSLGAYLLSPEDRNYDWNNLSIRYGELSGSTHTPGQAPGFLGLDIYTQILDMLKGAELTKVFEEIEIPLVQVLFLMEERGIAIDKKALAEFLAEIQASLDSLTGEIYQMAGEEFNLRSPQQLSEVLFTKMDLPTGGKTPSGAYSTSETALMKIFDEHPIIEKILEFRTREKLRSTYLDPLPKAADKKGRIHTNFNQTATATGRLSSSDPNLQNIPIRGPMGGRMRSCFIASEGKKLVCADYSQIELRVLAHLSQDPTLLEAFNNNEDIHSSTASLLFDVPTKDVTKEQRNNAKTINFGLIYGMGAQKLGQELNINMREAKAFIEKYFEKLSVLKDFYDSIEHDAAHDGYVATISGRRRLAPHILSPNQRVQSQARRQAINTRIQGSAADIIKIAMIEVEKDEKLKELDAKLLLQIHDELVLESSPENAQAVGERLAEIMTKIQPDGKSLTIPLLVDWGIGDNWSQAH